MVAPLLLLGGAALAGMTFKRISDAAEKQEQERQIQQHSQQLNAEFLKNIQQDQAPKQEYLKDRKAGLDMLRQLQSLAELPAKERKPQIEALSQQFEQMTGKPMAENALKTLSSTDPERLGELLGAAVQGATQNESFGLKQFTAAMTSPNGFMSAITELNKQAKQMKKLGPKGVQESPAQQNLTALQKRSQAIQDQRDETLRKISFATDALFKAQTDEDRERFGNFITFQSKRLEALNARFKQIEGFSFSGPQALSPGQVLVAGGGAGEQRETLASAPFAPQTLSPGQQLRSPTGGLIAEAPQAAPKPVSSQRVSILEPGSSAPVSGVFRPGSEELMVRTEQGFRPAKPGSREVSSQIIGTQEQVLGAATRSVTSQIQKDLITDENTLSNLNVLKNSFDRRSLTTPGRLEANIIDKLDSLGIPVPSGMAESFKSGVKFEQNLQFISRELIHKFTGASMGEKEAEELLKLGPNPGDGPLKAQAKLEGLIERVQLSVERSRSRLKRGLDPVNGAEGLTEFQNKKKRAAKLAEAEFKRIMKSQPGISEQEAVQQAIGIARQKVGI